VKKNCQISMCLQIVVFKTVTGIGNIFTKKIYSQAGHCTLA